MRTKVVTNVMTGETQELPYTPEEEAEADRIAAEHEAIHAAYVPSEVTPYQARMALLQYGMLDAVQSLMENSETPQAARIAWEYATVIQRHSAFIAALAPALGLTETQIDDLFRTAAQIQ